MLGSHVPGAGAGQPDNQHLEARTEGVGSRAARL